MINKNPLVSVVIPTFNQRADFLSECISSAIKQTYNNLEVILCDNWSTNTNVEKVLKKFLHFKNFKVIKPPHHLSMIDNFCYATDQANGEYLSFLSSDDFLELNAIEILVNSLKNNVESNMAFGEVDCVESTSKEHLFFTRHKKFPSGTYSAQNFAKHYVGEKFGVCLVGFLIQKKALSEIGGLKTPGLEMSHDHGLIFRWLEKGNAVTYINMVLGSLRVWKDENQKADNNRETKVINDLIEVYKYLFNNQFFIDSCGYELLYNARKFSFERYTFAWVVYYLKRSTNYIELKSVKSKMFKEYKNLKLRLLFLCCEWPFKPLLKFVIRVKNHNFLSLFCVAALTILHY